MNCQQLEEIVDSSISDSSLIEKNQKVSSHLENCPSCRAQLAVWRELRTRLRSAVKNDS